ncbi:MAG TPA: carbohydrate kinase family protein [Aggregatilinea sp.]|jgi:pseudouridine kinase|uniref:carbohydrate kinase family protein n=1 Tax=Aggregatilinea sp. TaxID=2806333 RepID=UPI002C5BD892|nr:carbohydrate kinase family protein [Aggregatilinea sp.]HML22802.1 carbohydrate kinase family protein [Aggregatilinea sp.]
MEADQPVLVIGASGIDIKGRSGEPLQMGRSNQGAIRTTVGGVARNIAENLARLEVPTILLSAVGDDRSGESMLARTRETGVDTSYVLRLPDRQTGTYLALVDAEGQLIVALSDYDIVTAISSSYLLHHQDLFSHASMIALDANLSPKALATAFRLAKRYDLPVCVDPTSPTLAAKLLPYLPQIHMVAPDAFEAATLLRTEYEPLTTRDAAVALAQRIVNTGVKIAIVTLAEHGLAYADGSGAGQIPALRTPVMDKTGAGDALTAAVIFGLLNEMPLDEAMRLGIAAASLTLRTRETVANDLSLDRLYDALVV